MDGHHCHLYLPLPLPHVTVGVGGADSAWPLLPVELTHPPLQELSADMTAAAVEEELLKQALLQTTNEFEATRVAAQEELRRMKSQALHLAHLLHLATRERDDALHALFLLHQRQRHGDDSDDDPGCRRPPPPPHSLDGAIRSFNSGDGGGSMDVAGADTAGECSKGTTASAAAVEAAALRRGLPARGRLVEAVMRSGPLLQTLMLAGPLPQWRHPPPELPCSDIPPVAINLNHWNAAKDGADTLAATTGAARSLSSPESGHSRSLLVSVSCNSLVLGD